MKTKNKNRKTIKKIVSLVIALMMTVAVLSAFALTSSAETGAPDAVAGATQSGNGDGNNSYFDWGNNRNDSRNGMPTPPDGNNGETPELPDANGDSQAPDVTAPNGENGAAPTLPQLPDQSGNSGQSGSNGSRRGSYPNANSTPGSGDSNGNQQYPQFQQPPTGNFGDFNGNAGFNGGNGGFNYSAATFWLLVGITGVALISLCAVGIVKLTKRGKKAQPAAQPANTAAQPSNEPVQE